ncbi:MAG: FHA domain-containing protein, partial [Pseudomonadota bacterium]
YFKYRPGAIEGKELAIELRQSNVPSLRSSIPATISRPQDEIEDVPEDLMAGAQGTKTQDVTGEPDTGKGEVVPEKPFTPIDSQWLYWLLSATLVVLVFGAIVVIGRKISERVASSDEESGKLPPGKVEPAFTGPQMTPERRRTEKIPEPQRRTRVGGYFPPPGLNQSAAILVGLNGTMRHRRFPMEKAIFRIGADPSNDLPIPHDEYVSGNHAYLRYEKGSLFIFDQASRNGTFVNGQRVSGTARVLVAGDRIKIGNSMFEVRYPSDG